MNKFQQTIGLEKEVKKLNHIDLLRGVAIILVVITHIALSDNQIDQPIRTLLLYGQIGVQLFFFLSAYTLCMSMSERKEENHIRNFYIRRYFRIAPLYYLGIITYLIVSNVPVLNQNGPLSHHKAYTPVNILLNVFFIHGFFSKAYNSIVPGGWSIGTEMLFYLMFPFIFIAYNKIRNTKPLIYLIPVIALLIANICMLIIHFIVKDKVYTMHFFYAFILNQLPVFTVGISYFFLEKSGAIKLSNSLSALIFLLLFALSFILNKNLSHNITLPIFVAAISFGFLFTFFKGMNLKLYILHRIGQLSFSIYVFHFLFAYPIAFKISSLLMGNLNPYIIFIIKLTTALVLSTLLAQISEQLIEKPGIRLGKILIKTLNKKPKPDLVGQTEFPDKI